MGNPISATSFLSSTWGIIILLTGAILFTAVLVYCWRKCCRCKGNSDDDIDEERSSYRDHRSSRRSRKSRRRSLSSRESEMIEVPYYPSRKLSQYQGKQERTRSNRDDVYDLEAVVVDVPIARPQPVMIENPSFEMRPRQ